MELNSISQLPCLDKSVPSVLNSNYKKIITLIGFVSKKENSISGFPRQGVVCISKKVGLSHLKFISLLHVVEWLLTALMFNILKGQLLNTIHYYTYTRHSG